MKNIFTFLLFLMPIIFLSAQTEKGKWVLGAGTKLNQQLIRYPANYQSIIFGGANINLPGKVNKTSLTNFNIQPNIGYFIHDGLMAGIQLGFGYTSSSFSNSTAWGFGFGPEFRKYFLTSSFRPYVGAIAHFSINNLRMPETLLPYREVRLYKNFYGLYTGIAWFPYSNFSLDAQIGYSYLTSLQNYDNIMRTNHRIRMALGFNFFF